MAEDDRAIVVGISHYPALGDLGGPENDALAFDEWLRSPSGGQVPRNNIDRILSTDFPLCQNAVSAKPTAEAVKEAIDKLHFIGENSGEAYVGRRLYLFMAGHGFARDFKDAALLMANAAINRTGHHFPGRPYANWFREAAFFKEVVLLMDCCLENYKLSPLQPCHLDPVADSGGNMPAVRYYYGLASQYGQAAREVRDASGEMRGIFTSTILDGLWQGPSGGGDVTGDWLTRFVRTHMPPRLNGQANQRPGFDYDPDDDIVFAHCTAPRYRVMVHANPADQSQQVEMWDRGSTRDVPPPSRRSNGTWEWELDPGIYEYGYSGGDPRCVLELMGKGRVIDVHL